MSKNLDFSRWTIFEFYMDQYTNCLYLLYMHKGYIKTLMLTHLAGLEYFDLNRLHLHSYFVYVSSEGSGEGAVTARQYNKYKLA